MPLRSVQEYNQTRNGGIEDTTFTYKISPAWFRDSRGTFWNTDKKERYCKLLLGNTASLDDNICTVERAAKIRNTFLLKQKEKTFPSDFPAEGADADHCSDVTDSRDVSITEWTCTKNPDKVDYKVYCPDEQRDFWYTGGYMGDKCPWVEDFRPRHCYALATRGDGGQLSLTPVYKLIDGDFQQTPIEIDAVETKPRTDGRLSGTPYGCYVDDVNNIKTLRWGGYPRQFYKHYPHPMGFGSVGRSPILINYTYQTVDESTNKSSISSSVIQEATDDFKHGQDCSISGIYVCLCPKLKSYGRGYPACEITNTTSIVPDTCEHAERIETHKGIQANAVWSLRAQTSYEYHRLPSTNTFYSWRSTGPLQTCPEGTDMHTNEKQDTLDVKGGVKESDDRNEFSLTSYIEGCKNIKIAGEKDGSRKIECESITEIPPMAWGKRAKKRLLWRKVVYARVLCVPRGKVCHWLGWL